MKRRNFLKWLGISPAGLKVVHDQIKEPAKPVKVEPEKVKPVTPQRVTLKPQQGECLTASSFMMVVEPSNLYPGQDGWEYPYDLFDYPFTK